MILLVYFYPNVFKYLVLRDVYKHIISLYREIVLLIFELLNIVLRKLFQYNQFIDETMKYIHFLLGMPRVTLTQLFGIDDNCSGPLACIRVT